MLLKIYRTKIVSGEIVPNKTIKELMLEIDINSPATILEDIRVSLVNGSRSFKENYSFSDSVVDANRIYKVMTEGSKTYCKLYDCYVFVECEV